MRSNAMYNPVPNASARYRRSSSMNSSPSAQANPPTNPLPPPSLFSTKTIPVLCLFLLTFLPFVFLIIAYSNNKNISLLQSQLAETSHTYEAMIINLTSSLRASETHSNEVEQSFKQLHDELNILQKRIENSIYDTSNVGVSVYENTEMFWVKSKRRWVFPCEWYNCRKQKLDEIITYLLNEIIEVYSVSDSNSNNAGKFSISIVLLGMCSSFDSLAKAINSISTANVQVKLLIYDEIDPNDNKNTLFNCATTSSKSSLEAKKKSGAFKFDVAIESKHPNDINLLSKIEQKTVDLILLDQNGEYSGSNSLKETLLNWFPKLKTDGVLIGHSYVAIPPSMNKESFEIKFLDKKLKVNDLERTKQTVDEFILSGDKFLGTGGVVKLAGDTSYFIRRKQVKLSDLFSGDGTN